jgi:peptidoglycan DL-endopeptidase RipA
VSARGCVARYLTVGVAAAAVLLGSAGVAPAASPPPRNPSDAQIDASRAQARDAAARVGELTNELAEADAALADLDDRVEAAMENANRALVDQRSADQAARQAADGAGAARTEADAAGRAIDQARGRVDDFIAGSYRQGSTIGSITAFIGARSPEDLLARAQLLNAVGTDQLDGLDTLRRAQVDKANKDSAARLASQRAAAAAATAEQAARDATAARDTAIQERSAARARAGDLAARRAEVARQLDDAQSRVDGLQAQRRQYQQWLAASHDDDGAGSLPAFGPLPAGSASVVINRALSQLGVPYAWGGGNADGPTLGIHDGGVADEFGDFDKVGFDCSGLMVYAFAGAGIALPHYSGYQYQAGRHVSLSDAAPGDMLFWGGDEGVHHVALYLGGGRMIEAPESGLAVRVTSVRYGGIMPFATRLL